MEIVSFHGPNQVDTSAAPAGTGWQALTLPSAVPVASGDMNITVAITVLNAAGTAAGSMAFVAFNKASASGYNGFPVQAGQTLVFGKNVSVWYKLTAATDVLYALFSF